MTTISLKLAEFTDEVRVMINDFKRLEKYTDELQANVAEYKNALAERDATNAMLVQAHQEAAAEIERLRAMMQSIAEAERLAEENRITVVIDGSHVVRVGPSLADIIRQFQTEIERLTAELATARQWAALWKRLARRKAQDAHTAGCVAIEYIVRAHVAVEDDERLDLAEPCTEEVGI
jgi:hypothetical protein